MQGGDLLEIDMLDLCGEKGSNNALFQFFLSETDSRAKKAAATNVVDKCSAIVGKVLRERKEKPQKRISEADKQALAEHYY